MGRYDTHPHQLNHCYQEKGDWMEGRHKQTSTTLGGIPSLCGVLGMEGVLGKEEK